VSSLSTDQIVSTWLASLRQPSPSPPTLGSRTINGLLHPIAHVLHVYSCPVTAALGALTHDTVTGTVRAARSATARTNMPTRVSHPDCPRARSAAGHQGSDGEPAKVKPGSLPAGAGRVRAHAPVVNGLVVERLVRK